MTKSLVRVVLCVCIWSATPFHAQAQQFREPELASAGELVHPFSSIVYGTVAVELTVSQAGDVESVNVTRDVATLSLEAVRDVQKWTFRPAISDGNPIASKASVILMFNPRLNNPPGIPLTPEAELSDGEVSRFAPPKVMHVVYPRYPISSVGMGTVVLEVQVGLSGEVELMRVVRDIKSLTPEAIEAVKRWTFRPARLDGRETPSRAWVAILFTRPPSL